MISAEEAQELVRSNSGLLKPVRLPVDRAFSLTLAEDIFAGVDIPAFNQSAMDGYAFNYSDWANQNQLIVKGSVPAGVPGFTSISRNEAARIFTGAKVPDGADTVVMQEKAVITDGFLTISDDKLALGNNVRPTGSEIKAGALAVEKFTVLKPPLIGFLSGIGAGKLMCYPKPSVRIIVTGNELQRPGQTLEQGQVYESNSVSLKAALKEINVYDVESTWSGDDPDQMASLLDRSLQTADMVLLTGGVSVGDYDYVVQAATRCGVRGIFHNVKQKPGKPLFFGVKGEKPVFGLPGNPSSVLTCFYEYVAPAIGFLSGYPGYLKKAYASLSQDYRKNPGLTYFLKGYFEGDRVRPLDAQESYRLSSFAKANCLIRLDEKSDIFREGDKVEIHILPGIL
jgi:molybdopterin molybdotransferase